MRTTHIVIAVFLAGCAAPAVPTKPGYETDIAPILEANCVRCHSAQEAIVTGNCIQLDQWDDGTDTTGACSPLLGVHSSLVNTTTPSFGLVEVVMSGVMPKDGPALTDRQKQIFENWMKAGYPKSGGNNKPPTIDFITPPPGGATINVNGVTTYDIQYNVTDPENDPVTWSLTWKGSNGKTGTFATGLTQGMGTVHADTSSLGSGTYQVIANLDDGSNMVSIAAQGMLTVPSNYNASPTVTVTTPIAGDYYFQGQTITISWLGNDDGAKLTCDVSASSGGTPISIATGVAETPGTPAMVTWTPTTSTPISPNYAITVTVHDDGSPSLSASGTSGTFTLGNPPQQVSFSTQLLPLMQSSTQNMDGCTKTGCHGAINPQQGLDLTSANAYKDIVNVAAQQTATCSTGSEMLIKPGDPNHSYLITKLQGSGNCITGTRMPKGEAAYSSTQIQLFIDWTLNGAPNN